MRIYNEIIIPTIFIFFAVVIRILSVFRDTQEARREIRSHFFLTGVELNILSLSIYILGSFAIDNFYGVVFQEKYDNNLVFIAIIMTIILIFLLLLAIAFFRCSDNNSWILKKIQSNRKKKLLRIGFILTSFVVGAISMKLIIDIVINSI